MYQTRIRSCGSFPIKTTCRGNCFRSVRAKCKHRLSIKSTGIDNKVNVIKRTLQYLLSTINIIRHFQRFQRQFMVTVRRKPFCTEILIFPRRITALQSQLS